MRLTINHIEEDFIFVISVVKLTFQARRKQNESGEAQKVAREARRRKWAW